MALAKDGTISVEDVQSDAMGVGAGRRRRSQDCREQAVRMRQAWITELWGKQQRQPGAGDFGTNTQFARRQRVGNGALGMSLASARAKRLD